MSHEKYMKMALKEAHKAMDSGEVPVGALGVLDGRILAKSHNRMITRINPTAHAEILVLEEASRQIDNYRLNGLTVYSTLEPCLMCYAAMVHARISTLVYGTPDPKGGIFSTGSFEKIKSVFNHRIVVESGILQEECSDILKSFFKARRDAGAVERGGLENR